MKISSYTEWDTLRSIVVGSATHANWPSDDPVFANESAKTLWKETPVPSGPVPQHIIDEANEDLNELAKMLTLLGVQVYRPTDMNFQELGGMYNYCPRDRLLIAGDTIVDPAMMYPCRNMEIDALDFVTSNQQVIAMPRDQGMVLDAANICRLGDTWLFLESDSGNRKAYDWLCQQFPNINIELVNFYSGVHIDSTITPLREGFVVLNGSRVNESNCPEVFRDWEKLWVNHVSPQSFYQYPYASAWIAMNMLAVNPHTVIVDISQNGLIRQLEHHGFTVIPMQMRHSRTLGGGFHCVTLDLHRQP
jgi:glycine amidinotransferase/scyllo-inosamine-4-phosphate amidinotransferase 1